MDILLTKKIVYEIETTRGTVCFLPHSTWNGMVELVDSLGRKLIVSETKVSAVDALFAEILDTPKATTTALVISASPLLVSDLIAHTRTTEVA